MIDFLRKEPALSAAVVSLVGAVISLFVHDPVLAGALTGVFAAFLGVRQLVTPVTGMVEKVAGAATDAATEVVRNLDATTVGTVGTVTEAATHIIDQTVGKIIDKIGGR